MTQTEIERTSLLPTELLIVLIVVAAGFIRGAVGFGDALFAMPLLAFLIPTTAASPLVALVALTIALVLLIREWKHIQFRSATILTCCGLAGVPLGTWFLRLGHDAVVKGILAVVVFLFALWSLKRPDGLRLQSDRSAPLFGLAAGLLGGAYNTSGPPLVIYGTLRKWNPQQLRATLQAYCLIGSVWIVVIHSLNGLINKEVMQRFIWSLPFVVTATIAGQVLTRNMASDRFARWVYITLMFSAAALLVSCLSGET